MLKKSRRGHKICFHVFSEKLEKLSLNYLQYWNCSIYIRPDKKICGSGYSLKK